MEHRYADILVAGAGPAGATIARLLVMRGRRVTLVDPASRRNDRLEIVSPSCCPVIEAVGVARLLADPAIARPCLGIHRRWGGREVEIDDFLRRPGGRGFVVDRLAFDAALRTAAADVGVEFITGRIVAARRDAGAVVLDIEAGSSRHTVFAELAIDATGRPSAVARRLGVQRMVSDRLVAERHRVDAPRAPSQEPTWLDVKGYSNGWSYSVSGPDGRRERWVVCRPGGLTSDRTRPRADASSSILSHAAGESWIAVGDAAVSFDPVTSQGLANALSSALVAAGAILSTRGLDGEACRIYSQALTATYRYSEAGRADVYAALAMQRSRRRDNDPQRGIAAAAAE
jgi:flavin-dependent dehydrogenase